MDSRRLRYLRALDIDVWQRRGQALAEPLPGSATLVEPAALRKTQESTLRPERPVKPLPTTGTVLPDPTVASMGWDALIGTVGSCTRCPLHATRTQSVFGVGNRTAKWMVIGEAPGAEEDRQGEPFVGRAGQLLNSMLKAIGLAREQVFIANILKSRPPNNRDPRPEEVRACIPYLFRQIELINPTLVLCVGRIAAQTLLETDTPIGKLRGRLHQVGPGRPMIVTYHPAYLLRSPGEKRKAWADLVLAMQTFERLTAAGQMT
jgi:DNA polymerase